MGKSRVDSKVDVKDKTKVVLKDDSKVGKRVA